MFFEHGQNLNQAGSAPSSHYKFGLNRNFPATFSLKKEIKISCLFV